MNDNEKQRLTEKLFAAYFKARSNKRNTLNQLRFELDFERNLLRLADEIHSRTYQPRPCVAFMTHRPVKREIFAAEFQDRVVHHLIHSALNPIIECKLIHDTYSCREGKGTLYGIRRIDGFIRSCTQNYQQDAYILKLDVAGYFRNINHDFLWDALGKILSGRNHQYGGLSREVIDYLLQRIIYTPAAKECRVKSPLSEWRDFPASKSLFHVKEGRGLPIGNLTSQMFGNVYLNEFDQFVKHTLKIKYYGRYVDDMVFIHPSQDYLRSVIGTVKEELAKVGLAVHPGKVYLQHDTKGVLFLGQYIKPYRKYISGRTKNAFFQMIDEVNTLLDNEAKIEEEVINQVQARMNSYLGILRHADTYRLIEKVRKRLCPQFYFFFAFDENSLKITPNLLNRLWHSTHPSRSIKSLMSC